MMRKHHDVFFIQRSGFSVQGSGFSGFNGGSAAHTNRERRECLWGDAQRSLDSRFPSYRQPSPMGKVKRRRLRRKKGSQPRLAALGSPFQGKGLAWMLPPSFGRRCPEGAEVGGGSAIPDTLPSPRGEGAPKGRIGHWRYEREVGKCVSSASFARASERRLFYKRAMSGGGTQVPSP